MKKCICTLINDDKKVHFNAIFVFSLMKFEKNVNKKERSKDIF